MNHASFRLPGARGPHCHRSWPQSPYYNRMEKVRSKLRENGQGHVLEALPELKEQDVVAQQIASIDIAGLIASYRRALDAEKTGGSSVSLCGGCVEEILPVESIRLDDPLLSGNWERLGWEAIQENSVAVVILSGGQGTRLGFSGPKGMFDIGLKSKKSIFELHVDRVLKVRSLAAERKGKGIAQTSIPIYVMTSAINDAEIKNYFQANRYFGYPKKDIFFFEQGLEPCLSLDEKLLLESADSLAMAPDGNGGIYSALRKTGALEDMSKRGIKHLHIYGIDNVLTKSADPLFIGACIERDIEVGNKIVWRKDKSEKVGTTVMVGNRMKVIEYSEIPPELAEAEDGNGKLVFGAANICNHYLSVRFLETLIPRLEAFYHRAIKKIPYYDPATKRMITPEKPNGVKLEMFIFDVFPHAEKWLVAEVDRVDEFAPVKNAPGSSSDSPDTARVLIFNQAKRWLEKAGATVTASASAGATVGEIGASLSYSGEGLEEFAGKVVTPPFCLLSSHESLTDGEGSVGGGCKCLLM